MNLLLVDDEVRLISALSHVLKRNGYVVDSATDGETAMDMAATGIYDIILLDRMLPKRDGVHLLKEYRSLGFETPVIILSAKDSPEDIVEGLECGADDYLTKPFYVEELLSRIQTVSRRQACNDKTETIKVADLVFDPTRSVVTKGHQVIQLTFKEAKILELLMRNIGQVIPTTRILERVWGNNSTDYLAYAHLYIHYLRKKLKADYIKTVQKVGYMFLVRN